jgi:stage II sporulation protein D
LPSFLFYLASPLIILIVMEDYPMTWLSFLRSEYRQNHRDNRGKVKHLWMFFWLLLATPAAAMDIRVGLSQDVSTVTVGSSSTANLIDGKGNVLGQISALEGFTAAVVPGGVSLNGKRARQITLKPKDNGLIYVGDRSIASGGRWYRGDVRLVHSSGGLTVVNDLNLEDYVASVIGKEMYPTWPQEALKAQAVAARSYAIFQQQKPKFKLFDVLSTTTSQVYAGLDGEANTTHTATQATAGQVLTYQGKVIESVFHSASGGHTENSENVWVRTVPYLRGVPDFDQSAPVFKWNLMLTAGQVRQRIPGLGDIVAMTPVKTSPTGRIQTLKVQGSEGSRVMRGSDVRRALGLRSTLFAVKPEFGLVANRKSSRPIKFEIVGQGSGHGLGLSQWGAYSLALQGKPYQEILNHYFQGVTLKTLQ